MKKILFLCIFLVNQYIVIGQPSIAWTISYPDSIFGATLRDAITDNGGNIIIAAARPYSNFNNNIDPVVLKYDPSGNNILFWTHSDSLLDETPTQIVCDSLNQLYFLTLAFGITQDTVHLIKIDGITGQELFNFPVGTGIYPGTIGINHQYVYVALGFPNLELFKYDLQGNLIWSKPIPKIQRVKKFHFYNEDVFLIGDSISSSNFVDLIQKFDSLGTLQWQTATLNAGSYNYTDSEIDGLSNVWITGYTNTNIAGYLTKIDSTGAVWDTLLGIYQSFPDKIALNNQDEVFWTYINYTMTGKFYEVIKINTTGANLFATVDSADNQGNGLLGVDINCLPNGDVIIANTRHFSIPIKDYEISCFNSTGALKWSLIYTHTPNSIEKVFRIFAHLNYAYLVGELKDSITGSAQINVIRIDYPTAIDEHNLSENDITIYPNPIIDNQINLNMRLNEVCISLYDCYGRIVHRDNHFTGSTLFLSQSLKSGIYFLNIFNEKSLISKKIIIN
ncbi:MAG: T9SS type A sorting domain-containing protein [Bacteroidetes bacterium]|nr:T9SS C-terminal target domain-containing protein [Bacteroidetes bacterium CHB6]MCO5289583.1 T9SS type A sorting domain-containing protein [Bacteroidota bacterium]MCW5932591.1 T9SS type A sorting domain-containing protein [Bacteroidota bacterium]